MNNCPACDAPMHGFACRCGYKVQRNQTWKDVRAKINQTPKTDPETAKERIAKLREMYPSLRIYENE